MKTRAFKMLESDTYMYIAKSVELLRFKVGSGNHQRGISLIQKFSETFGNMRLVSPKMTSKVTISKYLKLRYFLSHFFLTL